MKTAVLFIFAFAFALAEDRHQTLTIPPGQTLTIKTEEVKPTFGSSGSTPISWGASIVRLASVNVDAAEIKDVIKALEILIKYAPEKYDEYNRMLVKNASTFRNSCTVTTGYSPYRNVETPATLADQERAKAEELKNQAKAAREKAEAMDKAQEEIEWARDILAKWKNKLQDLN